MLKKVTSSQIAKLAGVSQATVSYVLNGRDDIPILPETKSRILKIAKELNYTPNYSARALVTGKTNLIRIWLSALSPYHVQVASELDDILSYTKYGVVITKDRTYINKKDFFGFNADGVLAFDDRSYKIYDALKSYHSMPYVSTGSYYDPNVTHVGFDVVSGLNLLLNHLKECGCKKIACLVSSWMNSCDNIYLKTYVDFCNDNGFEVKVIKRGENDFYNTANQENSYNAMVDYLDRNSLDFDGLFITNAYLFSVLGALKYKNIDVPNDVKVCTSDYLYDFAFSETPVTCVDFGCKELCDVGWELLEEQITKDMKELKSHIIKPKLMVRKSTIN